MKSSHADRRARAVVISAEVGAGHDGAADELGRRLALAGFIVDRHDFLDLLPPPVGPAMRASYKAALKTVPGVWGWALGRMNHGSGLGSAAARFAGLAGRRARRAIGADADVVVSTYPLASQTLGQLRAGGTLTTPVVTFLTDMSVHPLWVHPGVDLHLGLHDIAAGQARQLGAGAVRVVAPAVRPEFAAAGRRVAGNGIAGYSIAGYSVTGHGVAALRDRFHLPAGPLALVVAGSWGVGQISDAVTDIANTGLVTPVVACGHNAALRAWIARSGRGIALDWISDMPALINACDVVVQNAGGLTSLEAISAGVPVLTYRCLVGHGRTNADALHRAGWAPWVTDVADLPAALRHALAARRAPSPFTGTEPVAAIRSFLESWAPPDRVVAPPAAGPVSVDARPAG